MLELLNRLIKLACDKDMVELKVALLFDKKNDWMSKFFENEVFNIQNFMIKKFFEPDDVYDFDIVFLLGYTKILPKKFLQSNKLTLVVHESDLP